MSSNYYRRSQIVSVRQVKIRQQVGEPLSYELQLRSILATPFMEVGLLGWDQLSSQKDLQI